MTAPPQRASFLQRPLLFWMVGLLVCATYLGVAAFHVAFGSLSVDEGFYAAATRAVWQGEMPYRDFGFTQPPVVAYVNAPVLHLTGFGLFQQRAVNGVWSIIAVLLAARLVWRRSGPDLAMLVIGLFALSPAWMYFTQLGKTYGLTSLLVMLATTVFLESPLGIRKVIALSAIGVVGVGCRLPAAPFFAVLWLVAPWDAGRPSGRLLAAACGSLAVSAAALFLPFWIAAPEQAKFWIFDFHQISIPMKDWRVRWSDAVALMPSVWIATTAALGLSLAARRWWSREFAVVLAAVLALSANLFPRGVYDEYAVPFLPPLATAAILMIAPSFARLTRPKRAAMITALLVGPFAIIPALNWRHLAPVQKHLPSWWLPVNTRPYNFNLPDNLQRARLTVERLLPPDEPFIGPNIILAIEANRPIPRTMRMGAFTFTSDYDLVKADRLHLMTHSVFEKQLLDPKVPLIGLHVDNTFNYVWSVPSFNFQSQDDLNKWGRLVARNFAPAYADSDFVILARPHLLPR